MIVNSRSLNIIKRTVAGKPEKNFCHCVIWFIKNLVESFFHRFESNILDSLFLTHGHYERVEVLVIFFKTLLFLIPMMFCEKLNIYILLDLFKVQRSKIIKNRKSFVLKIINNVLFCSLKLFIVRVHPLNVNTFALEFFLHLRDDIVACKRMDQVENDHWNSKFELNIHSKFLHFNLFLVFTMVHLVSFVTEMSQTISTSHRVSTWLGTTLLHS